MWNNELKEQSLERLQLSENKYKENRKQVQKFCEDLYAIRKAISKTTITPVENYINALAKSPVELQKSVNTLQMNYASFAEVFNLQKEYSAHVDKTASTATGGGVAIGAGVGALAPTAAMAVATTFGVASTGIPIGALSGAAATNAALAWLGGGAIGSGTLGGGMAAGKALLAMAGPVGWAIAGVAIVGGSWWTSSKNKEIAEHAVEAAMIYDRESATLSGVKKEVAQLFSLTSKHSTGVKKQLHYLKDRAPKDYAQFTEVDKKEMASLINNINSLSEHLNKRIEAKQG